MSILLDALRKSEKNQKRHEVPTIHTEDQSGLALEPMKIAPLALLLVVALFVSGWLVWRQYQVPAGGYQPPVTLAADASRAVAEPAGGAQADGGSLPAEPTAKPAGDQPVARPRTPVETFTQPAESAQDPNKSTATTPVRTNPANQAAGGGAGQQAPARQPATPPAQKKEAQIPAPIGYWELPDAIRASVPEIKFSVLVYAKKPVDRFVLINGQRLTEGDSIPSGPVVKEIRRDGVIFSYRLYQFLVER